jgi:ABC-type bacteriocin/lantibiotic exporter with double-glycine peptidase domain
MNTYAQKKDGWCGPASLSYALMKQGIDISQEKIAKDTDTTVKDGVDPNPLIRYVNTLKLQTKVFEGKNADETLENITHFLYFGYSCIVDYLAGNSIDDGHYVVVEDIDGKDIRIWDPSGGKHSTLSRDYFIKHWKDRTENEKLLHHWAFCFKNLTY